MKKNNSKEFLTNLIEKTYKINKLIGKKYEPKFKSSNKNLFYSSIYELAINLKEPNFQLNSDYHNNLINRIIKKYSFEKELNTFNQYSKEDRKKILDSRNPNKHFGLLGIVEREIKLPRYMEKKGIKKERYEQDLNNLEKKITKLNQIRQFIQKQEIDQNSEVYLDIYKQVYLNLKGKKPIKNLNELENIKYGAKLLSIIKSKKKVTPIEIKEILQVYNKDRFKGILEENFFDKIQEKYVDKISKGFFYEIDKNLNEINKKINNNYIPKIKEDLKKLKIKKNSFRQEIELKKLKKISHNLKFCDKMIYKLKEELKEKKKNKINQNKIKKDKINITNSQASKLLKTIKEIDICQITGNYSIKD